MLGNSLKQEGPATPQRIGYSQLKGSPAPEPVINVTILYPDELGTKLNAQKLIQNQDRNLRQDICSTISFLWFFRLRGRREPQPGSAQGLLQVGWGELHVVPKIKPRSAA